MYPTGKERPPVNIFGRSALQFQDAPPISVPPSFSGSDLPGLSPSIPPLLSRPLSPQTSMPFSGTRPFTALEKPTYAATAPVGYNGPIPPQVAPYQSQDPTTSQSLSNLQISSGFQRSQPSGVGRGPLLAPTVATAPASFSSRPYALPSVSLGPPPLVSITTVAWSTIASKLSGSLSEPRATQQPPLYGYPPSVLPVMHSDTEIPTSRPLFQNFPASPALLRPPLSANQGDLAPPPPPLLTPLGFGSQAQLQYPGAGPPVGTLQSLVEDFESLSFGSAPGSLDHGIDSESLPRPLDDDVEPTSVIQAHPYNCRPRYARITTHAIPGSQSLLSRWHLPLGIVVHPLAESPDVEVPVVNFGTSGVVRCRRCRTYVNPYVTFIDTGRKWRCNICALLNDVPGEYFCQLDANGRRIDIDERPELSSGSVEIIAPADYMIRPPVPPIYFFLIDVSITAVRSGLLEVVANTIKSCIDKLPGSPRTQIGFITFDGTLHFYSLKSSLSQPQMMVVTDLDDIFLPLPDELLVNLFDSRTVVDVLLDGLPSMFQSNTNVESAFGPALKAAYMVLSQLGGKLLVFQSTLPSLGVGSLRLRENDARVYGTDKEHTLRIPEDPFYNHMAADFAKNQITVNIYAFGDKYSDIASLGTLSKYTGGQMYHYPSFQASVHGNKLKHELARDLTRETAWEAVMRIRCSKGLRFTTYHGHFMLRSTDLLVLPAVDCDKAFAMQISLEEALLTTQFVYFQVAVLYTSSSGERRIRVHTLQAPVVADLGEMYRRADVGATMALLSRIAIENTLSQKLEDTREFLIMKTMKSLWEYRNLHSMQHRLGGRLIYPKALKLLPLYVLSLCKYLAFRGGYGDVPLDERCAAGFAMLIIPIGKLLKLLYPVLMRIDESLVKGTNMFEHLPKLLPLSAQFLAPQGLYLCDNGLSITLWFGRMLSSDLVSDILGVDFASATDLSTASLSERKNTSSMNLFRLVARLRAKEDPSSFPLFNLVRQGEQPREGVLLASMIEDRLDGPSSYVDWMLQIYRQSQQNS